MDKQNRLIEQSSRSCEYSSIESVRTGLSIWRLWSLRSTRRCLVQWGKLHSKLYTAISRDHFLPLFSIKKIPRRWNSWRTRCWLSSRHRMRGELCSSRTSQRLTLSQMLLCQPRRESTTSCALPRLPPYPVWPWPQ